MIVDHLLLSRLTVAFYLFNDKMKRQYQSKSEVVGKDCTEQESLWILGAEIFLTEISCVYSLPEPHEPLGMLTAQTLSRPLHPLAPKPTDLCYHPWFSYPGPYRFFPFLLHLPPDFWLVGPSTGFSHSSPKILSLPPTQLFSSMCSDTAVIARTLNLAYFVQCCWTGPQTCTFPTCLTYETLTLCKHYF